MLNIKDMPPYIYIIVHLIMGFFMLWLSHFRIKEFGSVDFFWLTTLETANLVVGVFWGNWGWDNFRKLQKYSHLWLLRLFESFLGAGLIVVLGSIGYYFSLPDDMLANTNIFNTFYFIVFSNVTVFSLIVVVWIYVTGYRSKPG
ncbi:hypothetical protein ATG66_2074 [Vibrio sp. ES.051]|uniref:hypothetical protein n=1 Tax=Vibrio sp. ES.051 TaxID=1761909 RepID=UPI000C002D3E|nr:hypothetical protein [Vibrio sp. ES.051]PFG55758.1 hypothetical protein ATG66_2074 [Vibrio sp. ES.051]